MELSTQIRHVLSQFGRTLAAGLVAGGAAGLGARVSMLVVRLLNDSHAGENTHSTAIVGQVTFRGTLSLVMEGVALGVPGALAYLVLRPWIPGKGVVKGIAFGCVLLVIAGPLILDGNYEYFRSISTWLAVLLFAVMYPLFGAVIGFLAERWAPRPSGPPGNRIVAVAGWAVLALILFRGGMADYVRLRDVYHLFPS